MERVNRLTCPNCQAPLVSKRGIRIGRQITCLKCRVAFTLRPEDVERASGVNPRRLLVASLGVLLYLLGGTALAYYCVAHNGPIEPTRIAAAEPAPTAEEVDAAPAPKPVRAPGGLSLLEQHQVDDAIAKGVWFLRDHVQPDGSWGDRLPEGQTPVTVGFTALPALTLLECGIPAQEPIIQKAAERVRRQAPNLPPVYDTYQRALAILFLDRLGDKNDAELIQYLALCLITGQHPSQGAWTYSCPTLERKRTPQLLKTLRNPKQSLAAWRKTTLQGLGWGDNGWTIPIPSSRSWHCGSPSVTAYRSSAASPSSRHIFARPSSPRARRSTPRAGATTRGMMRANRGRR